ncbi:MAG: hypothetical protein ABSE06_00945 [Anaerolineaceae bacterium]|jgi:hypothetical protein
MDTLLIPAWIYRMLEILAQSDYAEFKLVVLNQPDQVKRGFWERVNNRLSYFLYENYRKIDKSRFKAQPDAFEKKDAEVLLKEIPVLNVKPRQTRFSDYIEDTDIAEIEKYDVDVFIRLGFRILRGKILKAARYGVWSYHHGDYREKRGGPAGFWEVMENDPVTGSILQILTEDLDNGVVLFDSFSATHYISVNLNMNNYYWKSLSFMPRKLKELHQLGGEVFFQKVAAKNSHPVFYSNRIYTAPKNNELISSFLGYMGRYLKQKLVNLVMFEQWQLIYDLRDGISSSFWRYKKLAPPKDRFWADPFVVFRDQKYYVFFEEYEYKKKKGYISVLTIDDKGNSTPPVKVLERPYHLSYPYLFEYEGDLYMIPESAENRTIEVYKCSRFPDQWEFHKIMMENVMAQDATLFFHNQKWWMFASMIEDVGASCSDELFLFYADQPLADNWSPHPLNPICSDVRRARPAGKIFDYNGNQYRPSQNSVKNYGRGMKINQVLNLTEETFEEKEIGSIEPNWDKKVVGIHTLNFCERLSIADCLVRRPKYPRARKDNPVKP